MMIVNEPKRRYFSHNYLSSCFKDYLDLDLAKLNRLVNKIDWYVVYWIKHKTLHSDVSTQGYVGLTSDFDSRMKIHYLEVGNSRFRADYNKYGDDAFECIKLHTDINAFSAYNLEYSYRPYENIGYNKNPGGTMNSRFICYPIVPGFPNAYSSSSIRDCRVRAMSYLMNQKVADWLDS